MAVARWLETDTYTNKDISSAVSIGVYTADADRVIVCDVSIDQAAGNGDYVVYLTRQINGSGSAYVLLPKTTCAAASGETAIAMQSGMISVLSGDVLTVYLDGLAGDTTTPDTIVRWFELAALQPATPGRTLAVDEDGRAAADVTAISGDTTAADNLEAVLDGTGGVTLTIKKLTINNTDPTGVGIQVNAYNAANIVGTNRGVMLQGGGNQALYMLSDTGTATIYIEGPVTGGKGIAISSPSDGSSLPGASGIYIQTEGGHPAILIDFTDRADAIKIVNSDNGSWVLDDLISAINAKTTNLPASPAAVGSAMTLADDAITAAKFDESTAYPLAQADTGSTAVARTGADSDTLETLSDQIDGVGGSGLTAQETRDALKLAPSAGAAAAGSIDDLLGDMPGTILTTAVAAYAGTPGTFGYLLSLLAGLDFTAVNLVATNDAGEITIKRTLTMAAVISGLTIPADWTACYWTLKRSIDDEDADALAQILVSNPGDAEDGLQVLAGAAVEDPSAGSLTVNQALGTVTIALDDASTAELEDAVELVWDVKVHAPGAKTQPGAGTATITTAVTRT